MELQPCVDEDHSSQTDGKKTLSDDMEETSSPPIVLNAAITPKISFAFHQNSVPVLREVVIVNDGDEVLDDLELVLSSDPAFIKGQTWHIARVGAGQRYHVPKMDVGLDGGLLARLTEAEKATALLVLRQAGIERSRLEIPIELLARNQWGGIGSVPELVGAFVQPNDPAVDKILRKAAEVLRKNGRDPALNGYGLGTKERSWELLSAIWSAVCSLGLEYALPPSSFEKEGQKVRSPSQICNGGVATCLDTTLLFAGCLEQCGLNPIVVFNHGHSFVGCWLVAEEFSTSTVDDVTVLRKRGKLNELVLFESTLACQRPAPTFKAAIERAFQQIAEVEEDKFELAVDIRRTRMHRIRPLASPETVAAGGAETTPEQTEPEFENAPDLGEVTLHPVETVEPLHGRLDRWQRKLLDLSLRNTLLNFKVGKKAVVLDAPDPGRFEDRLASGRQFKILPRPDMGTGRDPRNLALHEARHLENARIELARDALQRDELFADLPDKELESRLVEIYRSSRSALQEGGANTLFLSLGFLSWTPAGKETRYRAPLILIPVVLERRSVRSGFRLMLLDDESRFNLTLLEMLRQDFKLVIAGLDGELPKDESGLDIARIWRMVGEAVKDVSGFEVVEDVVLSTFSFAKYLMWKDLVDRTETLKRNPVVRHLLDTPREPYPGTVPFPDPRSLDARFDPSSLFTPLSADSSQLAAVIAAAQGKDFVLIGPPGTGKSQTIANLIAQCVAEGKSVLFVAEKSAALDVVYRRLHSKEVDLGEFCLELHSNKARKIEVLAQLQRAWEAKGDVDREEWHLRSQQLKHLRAELNLFVERLHQVQTNGLTAFKAIGLVIHERDIPVVKLSWPAADFHDRERLEGLRQLADRLDVNAAEVGQIAKNPLVAITHSEWSPGWQSSLIETAEQLIAVNGGLQQVVEQFSGPLNLPAMTLDSTGRREFIMLARVLLSATGLMDRLNVAVVEVGKVSSPSLTVLSRSEWSPEWQSSLLSAVSQVVPLCEQFDQLLQQFATTIGFSRINLERGGRQELKALAELLLQVPERDWFFLLRSDIRSIVDRLGDGLDLLERRRLLINALSLPYRLNEALRLDLAVLRTTWQESEHTWWPRSALLKRRVRNQLLAVCESGIQAEPRYARDLETLSRIYALDQELKKYDDLSNKSSGLWQLTATNLAEVERVIRYHHQLTSVMANLGAATDLFATLQDAVKRLLADANPLFKSGGTVAVTGKQLLESFARFDALAVKLIALVSGKDKVPGSVTPVMLAQFGKIVINSKSKLRAWCAWRKSRNEAFLAGLGPLLTGIENGTVAIGTVPRVFEVNYCRWWINTLVDHDEVLRSFVPAEHTRKIEAFKELDEKFNQLTRQMIRARLCATLPDQQDVRRSSEWGILRHEIEKKRRHMPLRQLIGALPTVLPRLAHCLLMSPLSIAQFLSAELAPFDVVVFDEASQIPVWDAVGAMARGKQVIVVGDQKQLPPTSFFSRNNDADDGVSESDESLESILDECMGCNLPSMSLTWHYRSRHEGLIAFSNHRYYGGGLVTFPSPVTEDRAVSYHHVPDGVYEKGGARINKGEARALVNHLVAQCKDPQFIQEKWTMGVVTFNSEQQQLIEDLLDEERRRDPSIEEHFAEGNPEAVFVKNLESVQGDERDIMYFSLTYGPDRAGHVSMNFGPMNKMGGERRLNVAITRARHALRVFGSLRADQLDLARTSADGVRDLKHFLEFAEHGPRALAEAVFGTVGTFDSPFEKEVAWALGKRGWQIHPQVGVSAFRIDLGVVDPDLPGAYLAGIECDGATYHRSATARDRDKLREQMLVGLGWQIVRIWSTEWWTDPDGALEKCDIKLKVLLEEARKRREENRKAAEAAAALLESSLQPVDAGSKKASVTVSSVVVPYAHGPSSESGPLSVSAMAKPALFVESNPTEVVDRVSPENFYDDGYAETLLAMIRHVVTIEGPVRDDILARRVGAAHGFKRAGSVIRELVAGLAKREFTTTNEEGFTFFWPKNISVGVWEMFRGPQEGVPARSVDEICFAELVALARFVRGQGREGEDALTQMAKLAGLQRLRAVTRQRLNKAWEASHAD